jgi:hypothetical protein
MDFVIVMIVVLIGTFAAFTAFVIQSGKNAGADLDAKLNAIPEFTPTLSYKAVGSRNAIAIDIEREKIAVVLDPQKVVQRGTQPKVFGFDDLVAVEVVRDDASVIKTQRGSQLAGAAVGGVLLGGAGLIVGGLSGAKRQENKVEKLSLKLYTNDLMVPVQEVFFLDSPGVGVDPRHLEYVIQQMDQWHGRLRAIVEGKKAT